MSTNPKQEQQRRRDEESRLDASHLAQTATSTRDDDDEDWGDVSPAKASAPKTAPVTPTAASPAPAQPVKSDLDAALDEDEDGDLADEDLENELDEDSDDEEEDEEVSETRETPVAVEERHDAPAQPVPGLDGATVIQQIDQMRSNLPALEQVLHSELVNFKKNREEQNKKWEEQNKKWNEEERNYMQRINFLRALSGKTPLAVEEDDDEDTTPAAPRRRGGRRKAAAVAGDGAAAAPPPVGAEGSAPRRGRGGRGPRHQNDQTLKQAICKVMVRMTHPQSGKPFTGFVGDITQKVMTEEGYKSTSAKPTNTVRIQMYRLEDEGKVRQNEDNSYTLRKSVVKELGGNPDAQPAAAHA